MIDLGSLASLHAHDHQLHVYCTRCDRWALLDLDAMVRRGLGDRRLPLTARCRQCGQAGQLQVRPPMPTRSSAGWISPRPAQLND